MSTKPEVTVAIPLYQGRRTIQRAVQSIQSQTYRDFEILVVDDGSSDGSAELVESLRVPQLRLLRNAFNEGLGFTRNRLLDEARGKYIAWLDQDDLSRSDRLNLQVSMMKSNTNLSILGSSIHVLESRPFPLGVSKRKKIALARSVKYATTDAYIRVAQPLFNQFSTSAVMMRVDRARISGLRFHQHLFPAEDFGFWSELMETGQAGNMREHLSIEEFGHFSRSPASVARQQEAVQQVRQLALSQMGFSSNDVKILIAFMDPSCQNGPIGVSEALKALDRYSDAYAKISESHHEAAILFIAHVILKQIARNTSYGRLKLLRQFFTNPRKFDTRVATKWHVRKFFTPPTLVRI